jgi:hypothetical protein
LVSVIVAAFSYLYAREVKVTWGGKYPVVAKVAFLDELAHPWSLNQSVEDSMRVTTEALAICPERRGRDAEPTSVGEESDGFAPLIALEEMVGLVSKPERYASAPLLHLFSSDIKSVDTHY